MEVFIGEVLRTNTCLSKERPTHFAGTAKCSSYPRVRNPGQEKLNSPAFPQLPGAQGCDAQPRPAV